MTRSLLPDELPSRALHDVHAILGSDGEHPRNWTVGSVWEIGQEAPGYAVVMQWEPEVRAFTVMPEGRALEVWDVTR